MIFCGMIFCDWYIEIAKIRMNSDDAQTAQNAREVLVWVMTGTLKVTASVYAVYYRRNLANTAP